MNERIIDGFKKDTGFIKHNSFKLKSITEEECVVEYNVKKEGLNTIKIVHGGLLFGLADSAAGALACMSGKFPVTISSSIHYLNAAKGKKLIAVANILKKGNNIGYYKVDIFDENKMLLCTCNIDMYLKEYNQ